MSELKACPFCGSNKIREFISLMPNIGECQNCGAVSSKWQSRPLEDALTAKIARLVEVGDKICEEAKLQDPFTDEKGMAILEEWNKEAHE